MQPWPAPATSGYQRAGSAVLRWACLALTSCWALAGTALGVWVFHAWIQPLPSFNPNDGPIGPDANISFWVGGAAMAVPLAALWAASAVTGSVYLSSVGPTRRAWAAWVSAVIAAVTAEVIFIGVFVAPGALLGMEPGRVNGGLLGLSAWFAAAGVTMVAIIMTAARSARQRSAAT